MSVYFTKLLKEIWDAFDEILFKKKKNSGAGSASEERYFGT